MKKIFLFAIAAATMAVGCQKIQDLVRPDDKPVDEDSPVEIKFTTNVANVETKANGAVTAFDAAKHTLYVYGLNKTNSGVKEITNAPATSTAAASDDGTTTAALTLDKTYFYNGTTDKYDFYGYYVDDAVTGTPAPSAIYELPVTITGQQDILLAKALGAEAGFADAYSAKTARAEKHPNLKFEHQLAQFNFNVRNCGTYAVVLRGAALTAVNEGTLTVAGINQGLVAGDATATDELEVSTTEQTLAKVDKATGVYTPVGVPVMVFPESEYSVVLYLYQNGMDASKVRKVTVPVEIKNDPSLGYSDTNPDPGALKGYAYDLNITVYSLEQITVTASLVAWKEGKSFEFDTEDNPGAEEDEEAWNPAPATLTIDKTAETISYEGGNIVVNASKEATVTIPAEETWITCTPNVGTTFTFAVASNAKTEANGYASEERTVDVVFTSGEETVTLTVTQAADSTM